MDPELGRCMETDLACGNFQTKTQCQVSLASRLPPKQCLEGTRGGLQLFYPSCQAVRAPATPLNPPGRVPVIGRQDMTPGLAGQGFSMYY